ncbi:DNA polymerase IV [Aurantivibrio plasticivorans]
MQRKIIHCDADCFYVAVESLFDKSLIGRPVAVGGASERRGVISTCSYEAREYGVRSAMSSAHAMRLCPDLLIIPPNMERYKEASRRLRRIFDEYSEIIEPLSLDEAFIDVTGADQYQGSATLIAEEIRRRAKEEIGITVSAGIGPNKFLAKVASDWQKPNGLTTISPADVDAFVKALPVSRIFGVGKVTAQRLKNLGVETCGDLQSMSELELASSFGSMGTRLYQLARGQDDRPVKTNWRRKSLSVEHTFAADLSGLGECLSQLPALSQQLVRRMRQLDSGYEPVKGFLKLKFSDFSVTTIERVSAGTTLKDYRRLCEDAIERGAGKSVRLIGIGVRLRDSQVGDQHRQLPLFPESGHGPTANGNNSPSGYQ